MPTKEYYRLHKDHIKEYNKNYKKTYYKENIDRLHEEQKRFRKKNREKLRVVSREYRKNNPEKIRASKRKWVKNNPEKRLKLQIKQLEKLGESFNVTSNEYQYALQSWSKSIKKQDNNTCQCCGTTKKLNSHHIFYKSKYPQLSLNINNGITLCVWCHSELHGYWVY